MYFLMNLGWYKGQATFPEGFFKVYGLFAGIATFSCEVSNVGVRDQLLVGKFGPVNFIGIGRGSGCVLGWLCGCQGGEVRNGNFDRKISCGVVLVRRVVGYLEVSR